MTACSEKAAVMRKYEAYVAQHARLVRDLTQKTGIIGHAVFRAEFAAREQARRLCESARRELEAHVAEHKC